MNTPSSEWNAQWFYEQTAAYPLLESNEERSIDAQKWRSLLRLFELIKSDPAGKRYIRYWAKNLLLAPPSLEQFEDRARYFTLRREHSPILNAQDSSHALEALSKGKFSAVRTPHLCQEFLSGSLIPVGMAKILTQSTTSNEVAAALSIWQRTWEQDWQGAVAKIEPSTRAALLDALDAFFEARSRLVNHNLRLVFSIARKLEGRQNFEDLAQDGFIGLIRAAEKYNSETGHRFSTYAYNWIMQSCRRGDDEMGAVVRLPSNIKEQITAIIRAQSDFRGKHGREPSRHELAKGVKTSVTSLEEVMALGNWSISTATPLNEEEGSLTIEDNLVGETFANADDVVGNRDLQTVFKHQMAQLKPIEKKVITRRWGLDQAPVSTRKQLAAELSVSIEWIRQVENAALTKLASDDVLKSICDDFALKTRPSTKE